MKTQVVTNNLVPATKSKVDDITPRDLLHSLIKELAIEASVHQISYCEESNKPSSYNVNVNGALVSLFLIKDEKDFMSVLGFDSKEDSHEQRRNFISLQRSETMRRGL